MEYWETANPKTYARIIELLKDMKGDPFRGIGKPEPLKYVGKWSRRITKEHRLIYTVENGVITIHAARFHYS